VKLKISITLNDGTAEEIECHAIDVDFGPRGIKFWSLSKNYLWQEIRELLIKPMQD
jgi:hypothetical protein